MGKNKKALLFKVTRLYLYAIGFSIELWCAVPANEFTQRRAARAHISADIHNASRCPTSDMDESARVARLASALHYCTVNLMYSQA